MSPKLLLRVFALLLAALSLYSVRVLAQDDTTSVADAARRARQLKQDATKPAHVVDNDAIPPSPAAANSSSNTPADANSSQATVSTAQPADGSDDAKNNEADALKKELAAKKEQVDFQKREMALAQDNYYSKPEHERDTAGKQKLDAMQADLTQAQSELSALEAKLAAAGPAKDEKAAEPAKP